MTNRIKKIRSAIMESFPNAKAVTIMLNDEVMDIRVIHRGACCEDDIDQIIVEGARAWKVTE